MRRHQEEDKCVTVDALAEEFRDRLRKGERGGAVRTAIWWAN